MRKVILEDIINKHKINLITNQRYIIRDNDLNMHFVRDTINSIPELHELFEKLYEINQTI